jgi:hypothetical protein
MGLVLTNPGQVLVLDWSRCWVLEPGPYPSRTMGLVLTHPGQRPWSWTGPYPHRTGAGFWNVVLTYLGQWNLSLIIQDRCWSWTSPYPLRTCAGFWNLVLTYLGQWNLSLLFQDRCWSWTGPYPHRTCAGFWNLVLTHLGPWDWSLHTQDKYHGPGLVLIHIGQVLGSGTWSLPILDNGTCP